MSQKTNRRTDIVDNAPRRVILVSAKIRTARVSISLEDPSLKGIPNKIWDDKRARDAKSSAVEVANRTLRNQMIRAAAGAA